MARSVSRLGSARSPNLDRPHSPGLAVAAEQRDQIGGVVGVQVGEEDLVQRVDGKSEPGEVRHRAATGVEQEKVSLGVSDLDQDARSRLGPCHPRNAAAEHRYAQLAVGERLAGGESLAVVPGRLADDRRTCQRLVAAEEGRLRQCFVLGHSSSVLWFGSSFQTVRRSAAVPSLAAVRLTAHSKAVNVQRLALRRSSRVASHSERRAPSGLWRLR